MRIKRKKTNETPQGPSQFTKTTVTGPIFGRFFGGLVENFGMMGKMWQCHCLPKSLNVSLIFLKGYEMVKNLSHALGTVKYNKLLVNISYLELC